MCVHTQKSYLFPLPAADEMMPRRTPAHCGGKKLFSNILHLPLFISLLWRMPFTACKLIYNAVSPPSWVEDGWELEGGGCVPCVCEKVKGLSVAWRRWKPVHCRANLIGAIFSSGFLDLREDRFRAVIGFGITMATTESSVLLVKEWDKCVCVCTVGVEYCSLNCHLIWFFSVLMCMFW